MAQGQPQTELLHVALAVMERVHCPAGWRERRCSSLCASKRTRTPTAFGSEGREHGVVCEVDGGRKSTSTRPSQYYAAAWRVNCPAGLPGRGRSLKDAWWAWSRQMVTSVSAKQSRLALQPNQIAYLRIGILEFNVPLDKRHEIHHHHHHHH